MADEQKARNSGPNEVKLDLTFLEARGRDLWQGEIPLVRCFWLYYFAAVFILSFLSDSFTGVLGNIFYLLALTWMGFMVMPVIRSADRFEGDPMWSVLAKAVVVLGGIGVAASILTMAG